MQAYRRRWAFECTHIGPRRPIEVSCAVLHSEINQADQADPSPKSLAAVTSTKVFSVLSAIDIWDRVRESMATEYGRCMYG